LIRAFSLGFYHQIVYSQYTGRGGGAHKRNADFKNKTVTYSLVFENNIFLCVFPFRIRGTLQNLLLLYKYDIYN